MARRIGRLVVISAFALGAVSALSTGTLDTHPAVDAGLVVGWILMPTLLGLSLWRPTIRYALIVPASLVSISLLAIVVSGQPAGPLPRAGWLLIAVGVMLGGLLGMWFWFRWLPVPDALSDPFARGRWALIWIHAATTLTGLGLVVVSTLTEITAMTSSCSTVP